MSESLPTTLADLEAINRNTLTVAEAASFLRSTPNTINQAALYGTLPWAYKLGARTVIPKEAFINYHKHGQAQSRIK